jgi:hypothetical protein
MSWVWNVMLSFGDEESWPDEAEKAVEVPLPWKASTAGWSPIQYAITGRWSM